MTNIIELKGNWNEQKGKLKQKFATLTNNDLLFADGKKDEMLGKLQVKLGKTKEELHKIIELLLIAVRREIKFWLCPANF